jgi:hypothetical protein
VEINGLNFDILGLALDNKQISVAWTNSRRKLSLIFDCNFKVPKIIFITKHGHALGLTSPSSSHIHTVGSSSSASRPWTPPRHWPSTHWSHPVLPARRSRPQLPRVLLASPRPSSPSPTPHALSCPHDVMPYDSVPTDSPMHRLRPLLPVAALHIATPSSPLCYMHPTTRHHALAPS